MTEFNIPPEAHPEAWPDLADVPEHDRLSPEEAIELARLADLHKLTDPRSEAAREAVRRGPDWGVRLYTTEARQLLADIEADAGRPLRVGDVMKVAEAEVKRREAEKR